MADLREEYTQHIHNTAPDMDKLWNRISEEIDKKENNDVPSEAVRDQIKRSGGYMRIAAIAAAFIVVFAGVNIVNESKKAETAKNNLLTSRTEKRDEPDSITVNEAAPREDMAAYEKTDEADMINEADSIETTVRYEQLNFNDTDTVSYVASYVPNGDEYFVEKNVLSQTDFFADVTVTQARLGTIGSAEYDLEVNALYDKYGNVSAESITIESSSPYILQENREYLLPLKILDNGGYAIVFENAPQIEITLDGGAVFQNGWSSLDEGSQTLEKDSLNVNDFYFDRMKYIPYFDTEQLINEWKNA